ncbi:MAG: carbon starvation CstA family protein [Candidatus Omnitrophota bacterium]
MNILFLILISIVCLLAGYFVYGRFLSRWLSLAKNAQTPAVTFQNNTDFVPAGKFYLLGQHLSAIAAAGPIVGPILAGLWFGWLPTFLWIILGGIFVGGVHDMASLVASLRHQGRSIAEVIKETMSRRAFILFLFFLWFSLVYIIAAFTDITASTFAEETNGPAIASSSMMYLGLAFIMGIILRKWPLPLSISTLIFFPFVFVCIFLGPIFPLKLNTLFGWDLRTTWNMALIAYCFIAAVIPVWILLQPRGYLGGFFLAITAGASFIGIIVGSFTQHYSIQYPAFTGWASPQGLPLVPILFTTVACGACSGFHCLIASGTTSKQLAKETDAKLVGYGSMLLESFVAVIALSTVVILSVSETQSLQDPSQIYANGIATFLSSLHIDKQFALNFALLAFATFVYDTLDVATRLGRYIFQELTGWKGRFSPYAATFVTLILPVIFLTQKITDAQGNIVPGWKIFWTAFGSSNQLLAALVLFGLSVWLSKKGKNYIFTLLPSIFMTLVAVISLILIIQPWLREIFVEQKFSTDPVGITGLLLLFLALFLMLEGTTVLLQKRKSL